MRSAHRVGLSALVALFAAAFPALAAQAPPPAGPDVFKYDASQGLDVKEKAVRTRNGVEEHDVTFASPKGGRVSAFLLVPAGKGPFAGILFLHGATGTRRSLLPGARLFCQAGAVCLLLDAPFCGDRAEMGKSLFDITKPAQMRDGIIQLVVDLRRGVDLLAARPDVDPKRLAFVGSSLGGSVGGILAGVDNRVSAYALMSAAGNWEDAALRSDHPIVRLLRASMSKEAMAKAVATLAPFDPVRFIGRAAPAALLFQNGRQDTTVPVVCAQAYQDAGSEPKTCKWYEANHELDIQAFKDRAEWLHERIGLGTVPEPTSARGLNH